MDQCRGMLQGLQQVGLEGFLEQGGHGPGGAYPFGSHRLAVAIIADHDTAQALAQVGQ